MSFRADNTIIHTVVQTVPLDSHDSLDSEFNWDNRSRHDYYTTQINYGPLVSLAGHPSRVNKLTSFSDCSVKVRSCDCSSYFWLQ